MGSIPRGLTSAGNTSIATPGYRFFKTVAGPIDKTTGNQVAYPSAANDPTQNPAIFYAVMLENITFPEDNRAFDPAFAGSNFAQPTLSYDTTDYYTFLYNLAVENFIELGSVVLGFPVLGEGPGDLRWYTIDKVPANTDLEFVFATVCHEQAANIVKLRNDQDKPIAQTDANGFPIKDQNGQVIYQTELQKGTFSRLDYGSGEIYWTIDLGIDPATGWIRRPYSCRTTKDGYVYVLWDLIPPTWYTWDDVNNRWHFNPTGSAFGTYSYKNISYFLPVLGNSQTGNQPFNNPRPAGGIAKINSKGHVLWNLTFLDLDTTIFANIGVWIASGAVQLIPGSLEIQFNDDTIIWAGCQRDVNTKFLKKISPSGLITKKIGWNDIIENDPPNTAPNHLKNYLDSDFYTRVKLLNPNVQSISVGPLYVTDATNDASAPGTRQQDIWINPTNVKVKDGNLSDYLLGGTSNYIKCSFPIPSLPQDAVVKGITITIGVFGDKANISTDSSIRLVRNGQFVGVPNKATGTTLPGTIILPIIGSTAGINGTFIISGKKINLFTRFIVIGSVANNGTYTVVSSIYDGANTTITVNETVPQTTTMGYVAIDAIIGSTSGQSGNFKIAGNQTALFPTNTQFIVRGSNGNDGTYTISKSLYDGTNTTLVITGFVPVSSATGSIALTLLGSTKGANGTFIISGLKTIFFTPGVQFSVAGSSGNNGTYVTASSIFDGANTIVTITGTVPVDSPFGNITSLNVSPMVYGSSLDLWGLDWTDFSVFNDWGVAYSVFANGQPVHIDYIETVITYNLNDTLIFVHPYVSTLHPFSSANGHFSFNGIPYAIRENGELIWMSTNIAVSGTGINLSPVVAINDGSAPGTTPTDTWSNLGNIQTFDGVTVDYTGGGTSNYLRIAFPNPNLPAGAVVMGIYFLVYMKATTGGLAKDNAVYITQNNVIVGQTRALTPFISSGIIAAYQYGDVNDLWGTTWTDPNIFDNWGLAYSVNSGGTTVHIDYVQATVVYSLQLPQDWNGNFCSILGLNTVQALAMDVDVVTNTLQFGIYSGINNLENFVDYFFVYRNFQPLNSLMYDSNTVHCSGGVRPAITGFGIYNGIVQDAGPQQAINTTFGIPFGFETAYLGGHAIPLTQEYRTWATEGVTFSSSGSFGLDSNLNGALVGFHGGTADNLFVQCAGLFMDQVSTTYFVQPGLIVFQGQTLSGYEWGSFIFNTQQYDTKFPTIFDVDNFILGISSGTPLAPYSIPCCYSSGCDQLLNPLIGYNTPRSVQVTYQQTLKQTAISATNDASAPGTDSTETWVNTGNVTIVNDLNITADYLGTKISNYLVCTFPDPQIPASATVLGITVQYRPAILDAITGPIDNSIKLLKGNVIASQDRASTTMYAIGYTIQSRGNQTDLWGLTWEPADFSSGFGVALSINSNGRPVHVNDVSVLITIQIDTNNPYNYNIKTIRIDGLQLLSGLPAQQTFGVTASLLDDSTGQNVWVCQMPLIDIGPVDPGTMTQAAKRPNAFAVDCRQVKVKVATRKQEGTQQPQILYES